MTTAQTQYQLTLNTGHVIPLEIHDFQAAEFATMLNSNIGFVSIGGAVLNKHTIVSIMPIQEELPKTEG